MEESYSQLNNNYFIMLNKVYFKLMRNPEQNVHVDRPCLVPPSPLCSMWQQEQWDVGGLLDVLRVQLCDNVIPVHN